MTSRSHTILGIAFAALALGGTACASHDACPPMDERVIARAVVDSLVGSPREDTVEETLAREAADSSVSNPPSAPDEATDAGAWIIDAVRIPFAELPRRGPADARLKILVVSDFQCPFCSRHAVTLERLRHEYREDIALYFVNFPLPFHDRAEPAAEAAIEAYAQGGDQAFYRMHDRLFSHQDELGFDELVAHAGAIGLDTAAMGAALEDHRGGAIVARDQSLVEALDVSGTPTTYIDGVAISGAVPYSTLEAAVERALAN